jgi:phenylalanyl-tRNA synthetase beta chain
LFESAHVYLSEGSFEQPDGASPAGARPANERHHLAILLSRALPAGWRSSGAPADFYAARSLLEALLAAAGVEWTAEPATRPFLHPGRAAEVLVAGQQLGFVGELHPAVLRDWELDAPVSVFEIDVETLAELVPGTASYHDVTSFPSVIQDIAVVVDEEVSAERVSQAIRAGGGETLHSLRLFDVYRGEQIGEGRKSLALRLAFHAPDRTLTDEEVAERRSEIERRLAEIGGQLRA